MWAIELDQLRWPRAWAGELLSDDERARAARFRFPRDRDRYRSGRGQLRLLLSAYLGIPPETVRFTYNAHGKPMLRDTPDLDFNLSHSEGLAVVAVTAGRAVGVDIERLRTGVATEAIAERFFSAAEIAAWRSLPTDDQERAFFTCWTRKEAFVKAQGGGLSIALDAFSVTLRPDEPAALAWSALPPPEPRKWSFGDLSSWLPGHVAAVVVAGDTLPVAFRSFSSHYASHPYGRNWDGTTESRPRSRQCRLSGGW